MIFDLFYYLGSVSQVLVDQAQIGVHFVWPNPLTNRFVDLQLHPSFWDGSVYDTHAGNGTGKLVSIGREAAILFEDSHTIQNNRNLLPTTLLSNLVVASFTDMHNFGIASSGLQHSNGRAFVVGGDAGLVEVTGFGMNNERNGDTHLWSCRVGSQVALRVRSAVINYQLHNDLLVSITP